MDNSTILSELLTVIATETEKIGTLVIHENFEEIEETCHAMKGVAGMYGLQSLLKWLTKLETAARNKNANQLTKTHNHLQKYMQDISAKLSG